MTCCGKAKNIVRGYANLAIDKATGENKYEFTDSRIRTCHGCDKSTWLTWTEYYDWLKAQGVVNIIKNFDDLSKLPELPKKENRKGTKLFCMICKCFIPAAARVPEKKCELGKW